MNNEQFIHPFMSLILALMQKKKFFFNENVQNDLQIDCFHFVACNSATYCVKVVIMCNKN